MTWAKASPFRRPKISNASETPASFMANYGSGDLTALQTQLPAHH